MHRTCGSRSRSARVMPVNVPLVPSGRHKVCDAAFGLLDNLRARGHGVGMPVGWVTVLVGEKVAARVVRIDLLANARGTVRSFGCIREHQLGAIGHQDLLSLR